MSRWINFFTLLFILLILLALSGPIILAIAPFSLVPTVITGSVSSLSFIGTLVQLYLYVLSQQPGASKQPSVSLPQQGQMKLTPIQPNIARFLPQVQQNTAPASSSVSYLLSDSASIFNNVMKRVTYSIIKAIEYSRLTTDQILMSLTGIFTFTFLFVFAWLLILLPTHPVIGFVFLVLAFFTPLFFGIVFGRWVGFLTGGIGSFIGYFVSIVVGLLIGGTIHGLNLSLYYKNGLWLNYIGLALVGFIGGFSSFREDIIEADREDYIKALGISFLGVSVGALFFFLSIIINNPTIPILTGSAFSTSTNVIFAIISFCIFAVICCLVAALLLGTSLFMYQQVLRLEKWARTPENYQGRIGDTLETRHLAITLISVQPVAANTFYTDLRTGYMAILVRIRLRNKRNFELYNLGVFSVTTGNGIRLWNESFYPLEDALQISNSLAGKGFMEGDLVFKVPIDDHNAILEFNDALESRRSLWHLGL